MTEPDSQEGVDPTSFDSLRTLTDEEVSTLVINAPDFIARRLREVALARQSATKEVQACSTQGEPSV